MKKSVVTIVVLDSEADNGPSIWKTGCAGRKPMFQIPRLPAAEPADNGWSGHVFQFISRTNAQIHDSRITIHKYTDVHIPK